MHVITEELPLLVRVDLTGVNRAPEWKDAFNQARHERTLAAVSSRPSVRLFFCGPLKQTSVDFPFSYQAAKD